MRLDRGDQCLAKLPDGRDGEQIDGRQLLGEALFLKRFRNPFRKFVVKPWLFEMVDEMQIMRVIENGRTRYSAEMLQKVREIPCTAAGQSN
jgi:hypothetical protein